MSPRSFFSRWVLALTEADTRGLAVFRIVHGLSLAAYVAYIPFFGRLEAFFTDAGIYPIALLEELLPDHASATMFRFVHTEFEARVAFVVCVAVCLIYAAGLFTRVASIALLVVVTSIHHRARYASSGAMAIANAFALYATLLPLGRHFSVDALLARRRGNAPEPVRIRSVAMLLVHVQLFAIYAFNVIHKHGDTWMDGTAVHYVLSNTVFAWPTGTFVANHAPMPLIRFMTYSTLVIEASIALAVISPFARVRCRRFAFVAIVVLHTAFSSLINVGPFLVFLVPAAVLLLASENWSRTGASSNTSDVVVEPPIRRARGLRAIRESMSVAVLFLVLLLLRRDLGAANWLLGGVNLPEPITRLASVLDLTQRWSMFSANPMFDEVRLLFVVELDDGRMLDTRTRRDIDFDLLDGRPLSTDFYWQKADDDYATRRNVRVFEAISAYVARRPVVDRYRGSPAVRSVEIHQIRSTIPPRGTPRQLGSLVLYTKRLLPTPEPGRFYF